MFLWQASFTCESKDHVTWFLEIDGTVWINGDCLVSFLGLRKSRRSLQMNIGKSQWIKTIEEIKQNQSLVDDSPLPQDWLNDDLLVFVNETAACQYLCGTKRLEAYDYYDWIKQEIENRNQEAQEQTLMKLSHRIYMLENQLAQQEDKKNINSWFKFLW